MDTEARAGRALARDLEVVALSLDSVLADEHICLENILLGIHAYLMALEQSGQASAYDIHYHLCNMTSYFHEIKNKA